MQHDKTRHLVVCFLRHRAQSHRVVTRDEHRCVNVARIKCARIKCVRIKCVRGNRGPWAGTDVWRLWWLLPYHEGSVDRLGVVTVPKFDTNLNLKGVYM